MNDNQPTKPWYLSKTILGGISAAVAGIISLFGLAIAEAEVAPIITSLAAAIGGVLAIYGRIKADTQIAPKKTA